MCIRDSADVDNDGIDDSIGASYADPDGDINNPAGDLQDDNTFTAEVAFREENFVPIVDLNSLADIVDTDRNFTATFTEGGAPVAIADIDAGIADDTTLESLMITVGGIVDGSAEVLIITGDAGVETSLPLHTGSSIPVTINGTTYTIAYDGTDIVVSHTTLAIPLADAQTLLRSIRYDNSDPTPTISDRTFDVRVTDSDAADSNIARSTVTLVIDSAFAAWTLSGDSSVDEGGDANYIVTLDATLSSAGETASVELAITDGTTNTSDYASLNAAVTAAVTAYNTDAANAGSLTWNGTTLTFTSDGTGPMGDLEIALTATDDSLIEGAENYTLALINPDSTTGETITVDAANDSVMTTIDDTDGNGGSPEGPGEFGIIGPIAAPEGTSAEYTIFLDGEFGAGAVASIQIEINDIDTTAADYGDLFAVINAAVAARPDLSFNTTTGVLTYTSPADGSTVESLRFNLPIIDDAFVEGDERFRIDLINPESSTGINIGLNPFADRTTTLIGSLFGGNLVDDRATWSLTGDASVDEGGTASYTLDLDEVVQVDEVLTIELTFTDLETNSDDHANFVAAVTAAIGSRTDLSFDSATSVLTYTSDGAAFTPLTISLQATDCLLYTSPSPRDS